MFFKDKLKKFRSDCNLTQQELAEKLFVSRTLISKWENGVVYPTSQHAEVLAKLMNVTIDELISDEEAKKIVLDEQIKTKHEFSIYGILYALSLILVSVGVSMIILMIILPRTPKDPSDDIFAWSEVDSFVLATLVYGIGMVILGCLVFLHTNLFKKIGKKFLVVISINILAIIIGLLISPIALMGCVHFVGFLCLGCYTFSHIF